MAAVPQRVVPLSSDELVMCRLGEVAGTEKCIIHPAADGPRLSKLGDLRITVSSWKIVKLVSNGLKIASRADHGERDVNEASMTRITILQASETPVRELARTVVRRFTRQQLMAQVSIVLNDCLAKLCK